jgi:hypothetical protein
MSVDQMPVEKMMSHKVQLEQDFFSNWTCFHNLPIKIFLMVIKFENPNIVHVNILKKVTN